MAKARNKLADVLSGLSKRLFAYLSDREETSDIARRIKLPLLGLFVTLIGGLGTSSCICGCYVPLDPRPRFFESSVTPNPTRGADTVTVKATTYFYDPRTEDENVFVDSAACYILDDDDTVSMMPDDGEFGKPGSEEALTGKLYVGDIKPKSTYVFIEAWVKKYHNERTRDSMSLEITEGE